LEWNLRKLLLENDFRTQLRHREATGQVQHASRLMLWAIIFAGASLGYYLLERLSQFASLP